MRKVFTMPMGVLLLLGSVLIAAPASGQFGITGGLNYAELDDIGAGESRASFGRSSGWHLHVWADLPLGPLSIRPGLRFMDMGGLMEDASVDDVPNPFDEENVRLLEVPVDFRLRLPTPKLQPYLMGGPVIRFNATDDEDRFRSLSLAGGAGVGLELPIGRFVIYPELKYTFGITRFTEESYELGGVTISPDEDQQLNAVMLSIGIGL